MLVNGYDRAREPSASPAREARNEVSVVRLHPQRRPVADGGGLVRAPCPVRHPRRVGGQEPASEVWPDVVEAMRRSASICRRRPKKLTVEMQLHADWAITLACGAQCPYVPSTVEDWDIPDPAGKTLEEVRAIRDAVEMRVKH